MSLLIHLSKFGHKCPSMEYTHSSITYDIYRYRMCNNKYYFYNNFAEIFK